MKLGEGSKRDGAFSKNFHSVMISVFIFVSVLQFHKTFNFPLVGGGVEFLDYLEASRELLYNSC